MDPGAGDFPVLFLVAFGVVAALVLTVFALGVVSAVRSRRVLRDNGLDPLTAHAEIAARVARGPLAAPVSTVEQRLAELADLHRRGVITDAEHEAGRRAAIAAP